MSELEWTTFDFSSESIDYGYPKIEGWVDEIFAPIRQFVVEWFCNDDYSAMSQIIISFVYGLLLSPWSQGLFFLTMTIFVMELLRFIFTKGNPRYYNLFVRAGVVFSSLAGFIIGRTFSLCSCDVMHTGFD